MTRDPNGGMPLTSSGAALHARLVSLREQHVALEAELVAMRKMGAPDALAVARLKKRKLLVRDETVKLEAELYPDISA